MKIYYKICKEYNKKLNLVNIDILVLIGLKFEIFD